MTGALAALDIALWDLKGKFFDQPIYKLIGGAWRTGLPFYASIGGNGERSVDEVLRVVEARLKDKPAAVKIRFDNDRTKPDIDIPGDIAKARAVRRLVGEGFPLAFDANNGYSVGGAIRVGRVLEELGYWWFEEPVQHYHVKAMGEVAQKLDITVSAGEQTYTLSGLADLIEAGVRMVQPDIVKMGGITGLMRCIALAHAHGVELVPHQTQPTIGHMANLHLAASQLHATKPCELNDPSPRQHGVFENPPKPVDGLFHLPTEPGLGLTCQRTRADKASHADCLISAPIGVHPQWTRWPFAAVWFSAPPRYLNADRFNWLGKSADARVPMASVSSGGRYPARRETSASMPFCVARQTTPPQELYLMRGRIPVFGGLLHPADREL